ncbi:hypothetical protein DFH06DRAFT_1323649 [Mycena polygramma]|nr:hypothetical protein DFH06DRAFT_1323649 [Mycena polygramma]
MGRLSITALVHQERHLLDRHGALEEYIPPQFFRRFARDLILARRTPERRRSGTHCANVRSGEPASAFRNYTPVPPGSAPIPVALPASRGADTLELRHHTSGLGHPLGVFPVIRHDYSGRMLVVAATADCVEMPDGTTMFRHAVLEPTTSSTFKRDDWILLVGMVHDVVRVVKNHGPSSGHPLCSVLECHSRTRGAVPVVLLLVATPMLHRSFAVEDRPWSPFTGGAPGSQVLAILHDTRPVL